MPFFDVTFSDGTVQRFQAHNKKQLKAALDNIQFTATQVKRCKRCKQADACKESYYTLCASCFQAALAELRATLGDFPISEQDLKDLLLSAFVGG